MIFALLPVCTLYLRVDGLVKCGERVMERGREREWVGIFSEKPILDEVSDLCMDADFRYESTIYNL